NISTSPRRLRKKGLAVRPAYFGLRENRVHCRPPVLGYGMGRSPSQPIDFLLISLPVPVTLLPARVELFFQRADDGRGPWPYLGESALGVLEDIAVLLLPL